MERNFTEQELVRRNKLENLVNLGIDPFGHRFERTGYALDIKEKYQDISHDEFENRNDIEVVAGRIMFIRKMGKETYNLFKTADLGDIVGVKGKVMKTGTGEVTIKCLEYTHLVKALKPLPEKFHGLTDIEERYRRRYVDLIMNEESRKVAYTRPKIIRCIQNFMDNLGFTEVETPVLQTLLTGAIARPLL